MGNMSKEYPFIQFLIGYLIISIPFFLHASEANDLEIKSINAQIIKSLDDDILSLKGNVIIKTDVMDLWADEATYDRTKQVINLNGNIRALSKNLKINAEAMKADFFKQEFYLKGSSFKFMEKAFGEAQHININPNSDIELLNVSISSCEKESLSWDLIAEKISVVDQGENAVIRNVSLKVNKHSIFYLPFVRTVIGKEKTSGFLSPSIKQGDDGLDLSLPYFFSLAPNYDVTVAPRYIQERGLGISSEARYLTKSSKGVISYSHFGKDKKFIDKTGLDGKRWAAKLTNMSKLGTNLFLKINTEQASDDLYFEDLDDNIIGTQQKDYLVRNILLRWNTKNLKLQGSVNKYHNLNPFSSNDYNTQPSLNIDFEKQFSQMKFKLRTDYSKFSFDDSYNPIERHRNLKRISVQPSILIHRSKFSSASSLEVGRKKTNHQTGNNSIDNSHNWAEFTHKIFMDKRTKTTFSTFNPIFKAIWIDGQNTIDANVDSKLLNLNFDTLFKRNWYSGSDLFLEESRLVLGIEHNFFNSLSGHQRYISFGRAFFNNKEKNLTDYDDKDSSFVTEFKTNLTDTLKLNSSFEIDSDLDKMLRSSIGVSYVPEEKKRIELRSVFKRNAQYLNESPWSKEDDSINQIELITQWKLSDNLSFFGKVSRDENISLSRDLSYGIEYANCCLKIGVMKRKWQDQDFFIASSAEERIKIFESGRLPERERDNLYFFFELVELGRFGKRISDVLSSRKFQ